MFAVRGAEVFTHYPTHIHTYMNTHFIALRGVMISSAQIHIVINK
jgi:hypothetical protein